jgi:hypothetical protein
MLGNRIVERLRVSIGDDEIHAFDLCLNHIGNRVATGPANPDHRDARTKLLDGGGTNIDAHCLKLLSARPWLFCCIAFVPYGA